MDYSNEIRLIKERTLMAVTVDEASQKIIKDAISEAFELGQQAVLSAVYYNSLSD